MARTEIALTSSVNRGTDVVWADADTVNGNSFQNNGNVILNLWNDTLSDVTISMVIGQRFDGDIVVPPRTETMEPGEFYIFGRFPREAYNDQATGLAHVDFTGPCKVAAVEVA